METKRVKLMMADAWDLWLRILGEAGTGNLGTGNRELLEALKQTTLGKIFSGIM